MGKCNLLRAPVLLASIAYKFFDKKTRSRAIATSKAEVILNEQLAEELHKPVTK